MLHKYNLRSAGHLEAQSATNSDIGVNTPPASLGTWRRSINTNEPMSLGSTHDPRIQQQEPSPPLLVGVQQLRE